MSDIQKKYTNLLFLLLLLLRLFLFREIIECAMQLVIVVIWYMHFLLFLFTLSFFIQYNRLSKCWSRHFLKSVCYLYKWISLNKVVTESNMYHFSSIDGHTNSFSLSLINEEIDFDIFPSLDSLLSLSLSYLLAFFVVQDKIDYIFSLWMINYSNAQSTAPHICVYIY